MTTPKPTPFQKLATPAQEAPKPPKDVKKPTGPANPVLSPEDAARIKKALGFQ